MMFYGIDNETDHLATSPPRPPQPIIGVDPAAPETIEPPPRESTGSLIAFERHLQTAILGPNARTRLVSDAIKVTGGDRVASIRKVPRDLEEEDRRWS